MLTVIPGRVEGLKNIPRAAPPPMLHMIQQVLFGDEYKTEQGVEFFKKSLLYVRMLVCINDRVRLTEIVVIFESDMKTRPVAKVS